MTGDISVIAMTGSAGGKGGAAAHMGTVIPDESTAGHIAVGSIEGTNVVFFGVTAGTVEGTCQ